MRSVEILGAAGEVTGSAVGIKSNNGTEILVDAGMFQGNTPENNRRNRSLNGHDPNQFAAIFITHAHLDHVGRLPHLYESEAPIYMTPATRALAGIVLRNADSLSPGLYLSGSVSAVLKRTTTIPYDTPIGVDEITATFRNAGHILGSASLEMKEPNGEITVFSGDLGNIHSHTVQPATPIKQASVAVMETTYGGRNHLEEDPIEIIMDAIRRIIRDNGTLLIPAFTIDRTPNVTNKLKGLIKKKLGIPTFLDTPMGIDGLKIYDDDEYRPLLNDELKAQEKPFNFPGLVETYTSKKSRAIPSRGPKIIIAGSGMMTGGRIIDHAEKYLPDKNSVILFVGYPAEGTLSRQIADGEKKVSINGSGLIPVKATVLRTSALSAHADQQELLNWLRNINCGEKRLRKVILVHGSNESREKFAHLIRTELGIENVSLPKENEIINLQSNK